MFVQIELGRLNETAVAELAIHVAGRPLDELCQRRILLEQGADAYTFSHDKLRQAAYASLSCARRRLLRVGGVLDRFLHLHRPPLVVEPVENFIQPVVGPVASRPGHIDKPEPATRLFDDFVLSS